jgi:hypothetical protein
VNLTLLPTLRKVSLVAPDVSKTDRKCHFRREHDQLTDLLASCGAKERSQGTRNEDTRGMCRGGEMDTKIEGDQTVNPAALRYLGGRPKIF